MSGSTRSTSNDRRPPGRGAAGRSLAADVSDELDQFVDSEPLPFAAPARPIHPLAGLENVPEAVWAERGGGDVIAEARTAAPARTGEAPEEAPDAAFSQKAASTRRDAFARRLDEELSRPRPPLPSEHKAAEAAPAAGRAAQPGERDGPAPAAERARLPERQLPAPSPERVRSSEGKAAAPPARTRAGEKEPAIEERRETPPPRDGRPGPRDGIARRSLATPTTRPADAQEPVAPRADQPAGAAPAPPPAGGRAPAPKTGPPEEPADALEWELDNAIGAIIANNRGRASDPAAAEAADDATPAAAPEAGTQAAADSGEEVDCPAEHPVAPAGPVGGRRARPIPTFRYERRREPDDPVPAVPPDADDPLTSVFLSDAREALEEARGRGDAEAEAFLAELAEEDLEAERGRFDTVDEDELPPSLSRAARGRRRSAPAMRSVRIAAAIAGIAVVALVAAVVVNLFGPSDRGASEEPPVIRANARDVKVRAEDTGTTAEPDIVQRTQLDETDELRLPEAVSIDVASLSDDTGQDDPSPASRTVRTVIVGPDGTILPGESGAAGGRADAVSADASGAAPPVSPGPETGTDVALEAAAPFGADTSWLRSASPRAGESAPDDAPVIGEEPAPGDGDRQSAGEEARLASAAPVAVPRPRPETWPPSVAAGSSRESPARGEARTAVAPVASAPWMVQLAAQRNRGDAERSLARISERYGAVLGERQPAIVRSDLGSRGVFYRVRVAAPSEADALALCERLRSAGADCFAGPN